MWISFLLYSSARSFIGFYVRLEMTGEEFYARVNRTFMLIVNFECGYVVLRESARSKFYIDL